MTNPRKIIQLSGEAVLDNPHPAPLQRHQRLARASHDKQTGRTRTLDLNGLGDVPQGCAHDALVRARGALDDGARRISREEGSGGGLGV